MSSWHAAGGAGALLGVAVAFIEFAAGQWHSSTSLGCRERHSCVLLSQLCFCLISSVGLWLSPLRFPPV